MASALISLRCRRAQGAARAREGLLAQRILCCANVVVTHWHGIPAMAGKTCFAYAMTHGIDPRTGRHRAGTAPQLTGVQSMVPTSILTGIEPARPAAVAWLFRLARRRSSVALNDTFEKGQPKKSRLGRFGRVDTGGSAGCLTRATGTVLPIRVEPDTP